MVAASTAERVFCVIRDPHAACTRAGYSAPCRADVVPALRAAGVPPSAVGTPALAFSRDVSTASSAPAPAAVDVYSAPAESDALTNTSSTNARALHFEVLTSRSSSCSKIWYESNFFLLNLRTSISR